MDVFKCHDACKHWNTLGKELGFEKTELESIGMKKALLETAPVSYLQEVLNRWVQYGHQDKPTLAALRAALRSSSVNLGSLADKLDEEMKCNFRGSNPDIIYYYKNPLRLTY